MRVQVRPSSECIWVLEAVLDKDEPQKKLVIVRSVVPTRDMGFLPGGIEEKIDTYTAPYRSIAAELFDQHNAYELLERRVR